MGNWLGVASGAQLVIALIASCGGKTADDSGGSGGTTPDGGGQSGGSLGIAGDGSGGTGRAGSGVLPSHCTLPAEPGPCDAALPAYYHEVETGLCLPFTYSGCNGNANRFESQQRCQETCRGGTPDLDTCDNPTNCVLATTSCCGLCVDEPLTSLFAMHRNIDPEKFLADRGSGTPRRRSPRTGDSPSRAGLRYDATRLHCLQPAASHRLRGRLRAWTVRRSCRETLKTSLRPVVGHVPEMGL